MVRRRFQGGASPKRGLLQPRAAGADIKVTKLLKPTPQDGIVKLTGFELADQRRPNLSRGELTPFSERGNVVLLKDIAVVEVAVLVEMVVDLGIGGGGILESFCISEPSHCSFSSPSPATCACSLI